MDDAGGDLVQDRIKKFDPARARGWVLGCSIDLFGTTIDECILSMPFSNLWRIFRLHIFCLPEGLNKEMTWVNSSSGLLHEGDSIILRASSSYGLEGMAVLPKMMWHSFSAFSPRAYLSLMKMGRLAIMVILSLS